MKLKEYRQLLEKAEIMWINCPKEGQNVLLPNGIEIRNNYFELMFNNLKKIGYSLYEFPIILDKSFLMKQAKFEDFSKGIIWISGFGKRINEVYLRPSGEGIIYPSVKKHLRSKHQLPIRIFSRDLFFRNSLRKKRDPFISGSGKPMFEGHGFFSSDSECLSEIKLVMNSMENAFSKINIYPIRVELPLEGNKKISVKTYGLITFLPNKKAITLSTFYFLGDKYSREFNISYAGGGKHYVKQMSFGFTDRPIGLLIKYFSDKNGIVIPRLLSVREVSIIVFNHTDSRVRKALNFLEKEFRKNNVKFEINYSQDRNKLFEKIQAKGVPFIISVGKKEINNKKIKLENLILRRTHQVEIKDLIEVFKEEQIKIDRFLIKKSKDYKIYNSARESESLRLNLTEGFISKIFLCGSISCANKIKTLQKGEILGFVVNDNLERITGGKCVFCDNLGDLTYYGLRV